MVFVAPASKMRTTPISVERRDGIARLLITYLEQSFLALKGPIGKRMQPSAQLVVAPTDGGVN